MKSLGQFIFILLTSVTFMIGLESAVVEAQPPSTCPAMVETALNQLSGNCGEMNRNTACYGYNRVDSTFYRPVAEGFFSQPSERANLVDLETIVTSPLDVVSNEWGMAVLNAQANVPGTIPGQGVTILLLGDALIENRVDPEEAVVAADPIEVNVGIDAVIREEPNREANVVTIVASDTALLADAIEPSGTWVRVLYGEQIAWVGASDLSAGTDLSSLPVVGPDSLAPMQAFYFTTGIGPIQCQEAPNVVTIQGNENIVVDLNINGANVRIGSTIDFRSIGDDLVTVTVREGHMEIVDTGEVVNAGETITGRTDTEETIVEWLDTREANAEELAIGAAAQNALNRVLGAQSGFGGLSEIIHIVVSGDTLYSIGQLYQASLPEIVERNDLDARGTIFVGQRLVIPNPGSGFVGLPNSGNTVTGSVTCAGLTATSPTSGLAYGMNTFYWNAYPGATSYRVNVINNETGQIVSFNTVGSETTVSGVVDVETAGPGYNFSWNVQALIDGQVVCGTQALAMQRSDVSGNLFATAVPPFSAGWSCSGLDVVISWSNAQPGEAILVEFTFNASPLTFSGTGPSGSVNFTVGVIGASNGKVTAASGASVTLAPSPITCP